MGESLAHEMQVLLDALAGRRVADVEPARAAALAAMDVDVHRAQAEVRTADGASPSSAANSACTSSVSSCTL